MPQTFATNARNDIYLDANGNLAIAAGIIGCEQACQTASQAQLGEMVLAITSGVPNFQTVWNGSPNLSIFQAYLRNTLLSVKSVLSVISLSASVRDGTLFYTAQISSTFGLLELNGKVPG